MCAKMSVRENMVVVSASKKYAMEADRLSVVDDLEGTGEFCLDFAFGRHELFAREQMRGEAPGRAAGSSANNMSEPAALRQPVVSCSTQANPRLSRSVVSRIAQVKLLGMNPSIRVPKQQVASSTTLYVRSRVGEEVNAKERNCIRILIKTRLDAFVDGLESQRPVPRRPISDLCFTVVPLSNKPLVFWIRDDRRGHAPCRSSPMFVSMACLRSCTNHGGFNHGSLAKHLLHE